MKDDKQHKPGDKPKGWHSRRHETSAEHDQARMNYQADHSPRARQLRALDRRLNALDDYMTETWWDTVNCEKRFPEYRHLTANNQALFRERKVQQSQDEVDNLRVKLGISIHTGKVRS